MSVFEMPLETKINYQAYLNKNREIKDYPFDKRIKIVDIDADSDFTTLVLKLKYKARTDVEQNELNAAVQSLAKQDGWYLDVVEVSYVEGKSDTNVTFFINVW